ncbi:LacI family DNA-binding transcriptional regulator [Occultella gossypii]|uniref:LacI family DNA-binding transcriptional regulator n=1 Tax=Occultella gossypii TaxID=2800820 RepID=A0ABS7S8F2_9MICO|nr:LacI family DNA-binding transcriptional regulator [Occultella gossypii]MBZ2195473.1 LacI family DNA-binding transcriptional regulator [Occultella gossypii]
MASIPIRRATLVDVAAAAGVSRSTASRVLSGEGAVSAETEARVRAAAAEVGYLLNSAARTLRTSRTMLTGLVLNNLVNATFHVVAEIVQQRLALAGYRMILCVTGGQAAEEADYLQTLAEQGVDGIIVAGSGANIDQLNTIHANGTAIVNLIRAGKGAPGDRVLASDRDGAVLATQELLDLGHRRIGYIGGPAQTNSGRERFHGYRSTLRTAGAFADDLVLRGPFSPDFGAEAIKAILRAPEPPSAVYIANHEASFGALPTLRDLKVRLPDDLSLIAHDEPSWFQYWDPAVSIVDSGATELAELAASRLIAAMRPGGTDDKPREFRVGARLVTRGSSAPVTPRA